MSDITGTPLPKAVDPANRVTDRAGTVSKDPARSETQAKERHGEQSTKNDRSDALHGRDPAVSISASAAHLEIGERLKQQVNKVDLEGRPIIVTETATFALRPDAGLRPGDDVELEIVEAGKKVSADLFMKNGRLIDPPIRLALIVIAIHAPEGDPAQAQGQSHAATSYSSYSRNVSLSEDPEALAKLLGARASTLPNATNNTQPYTPPTPIAPPPQPGQPRPAPHVLVADNPDKVGARSNSSDLATLIAAQQGQAPRAYPFQPSTPQASLMPGAAPPDGAHFIPKSPLTAMAAEAGPKATGLGPPLPAFTLEGSARTLQLMDPAISRVIPAEVAVVQTVQPLAPELAKTLPMSVAQISAAGAPLAKVETSLGNFVMPLPAATGLSGEQVRVSTPEAAQPPAQATTVPTGFKARLVPPTQPSNQQAPRNIVMNVLADTTQADPAKQQATVKAVHIARAFLGPDGPRADLRIDTTRGLITATLPNALRPAIGASIEFSFPPVADNAPLPASMTYANAPTAVPTAAVVPEAASMTALSHQAWPALQESMTLLAAHDPAAMSSLVTKSADGGGKLANSLLFFLAAAGRGNPEGWIGDEASKALERHNRSLLDMLKQDVAQLMTRATEGAGDWRQVLLPFDARGGDMPLIAMLFGQGPHVDPDREHAGREGQDGKDDEDLKRFVLEVQFSILGPVQLDGVIRGQKFDLTLRTTAALPSGLRHDAIRLFDDALAASAFTGQLNIQEQTAFPVDVAAIMAGGKA
ncbi:hypothetical protein [Kordiimonas aestuarii]|uniref:hypothetical protein n=1 Tax=Kordiimonas aestuarii TaxID=1005925 RepID=UPI0021CF5CF2|nr:hypothetical protein [Kordiimonas aestuarii]